MLLTVDTLRADHLSGYGYRRATSPHIDAFLDSAVTFEDAQANAGWTLPSLASIMTSLHPSSHGCTGYTSRLDEAHVTLAELLRDHGYRTHGIGSHTFLREAGGLQQGFDGFDDALIGLESRTDRHVSSVEITDRALHWLEARAAEGQGGTPWLLWLHYFDPHAAYVAHDGVSSAFGEDEPVDLYDGEIAFTDREIGRVLERLARSGDASRTIVVFAADHGEAFGEHGLDSHSTNLFAEVTRIPFAIRAPRFEPRRVTTPVESLDILPTVLALLGLPVETGLAGRSLVAAMDGEPLPERPILAETEMRSSHTADSLTLGRWKLIADRSGALQRTATGGIGLRARGAAPGPPRAYLFDRRSDPEEHLDVSGAHPDVAARLTAELDAMLRSAEAGRRAASGEAALSPAEQESLRALGYIEEASGDSEPARARREARGSSGQR